MAEEGIGLDVEIDASGTPSFDEAASDESAARIDGAGSLGIGCDASLGMLDAFPCVALVFEGAARGGLPTITALFAPVLTVGAVGARVPSELAISAVFVLLVTSARLALASGSG